MKKYLIIAFFIQVITVGFVCAQSNTDLLKGIVLDLAGEPIIGASVILKNTTIGGLTDATGQFSLRVRKSGVLIISYIGFESKEVSFNIGDSNLRIILQEDLKLLDEVVVVGYGKQKKQTVTGAVSIVKTEELTDIPVSNLNNALSGKVPGLLTVQSSGRPGEDAAAIYVRGRSTWVNSSPLIIVDGMERESFSQIDPNEVESISVLKDASSTAVYGVRGANGVILITTKRGSDEKPKIHFSANFSIQKPTRIPQFLDSYNQLLLMKQAYINDGKDPVTEAPALLTDEALEGFRQNTDPYKYPNVVWYHEMMKDYTPQQQYSINVSGGNPKVKYFTSLSYFSQSGIFKYTDRQTEYNPDSYYKRFNFRTNLDVKLNKYQTLNANVSGRVQEQNGPPNMNSIMQDLIAKAPYLHPVFNPDGSIAAIQGNGNPLSKIAYSGYENTKINNYDLIGILHNDLSFLTPGLSFEASVSYMSNVGSTKKYRDLIDTYYYSPITERYSQISEDDPFDYTGEFAAALFKREGIQLKLNYNKSIKLNELNFTLVYNQQKDFSGIDLPRILMGYAGRMEYSYDKKYMAEFNLGYNGSENFAKKHRFGLFPALSFGYIVTEEKFIKTVLPYFKIRGSIGLVGNDKIGQRFLYQGLYNFFAPTDINSAQFYMFGTNNPTNSGGIKEMRSENLALTWETALKQNIGVDGHLFGSNLLSFSIDYFYEHRKNILMQARSLLQSTGVPSPVYNIGEVENKGFELELTHRNKVGKFEYYLKTQFSFARNKILNYDDPSKMPDYQKYAGYNIGQFRGYQVLGFFENIEDIANSPSQSSLGGRIVPGDLKYLDYKQDNVINEQDIIPIGYSNVPEVVFSFVPGFSWKGFDASLMFQGAARSSVFFASNAGFEFGGAAGGGQVTETHKNYWRADNPNPSYPSLHMDTGHSNKKLNSFHLKKGDYLRLKTFQIGYSLNKKMTKKIGVELIRLFVSGSNVFTWSYLDNFDPEVITQSGEVYPQQSVYNLGVNVNF